MSQVYVVIENKKDWTPYYPSSNVVTFEEYLELHSPKGKQNFVINLCRNYKYLSKGYYVSLLAEARGHRVIPNVKAINDLSRKAIYGLQVEDFSQLATKVLGRSQKHEQNRFELSIHFGMVAQPEMTELAWRLFELYPFPILNVKFHKNSHWTVEGIKPGSIHQLKGDVEDSFAEALDRYDKKIWRKPRLKRRYRYDLAILVDPTESFPPSDKNALKKMIRSAKDFSIQAELIERRDFNHLREYDGLFIRATTSIDHFTYTFSRKAESEGLVVIDDPTSILKCANKVYLHEQMQALNIPTPKTLLLDPERVRAVAEEREALTYPLVLKIPDGSFSTGVFLVNNKDELLQKCSDLFERSVLVLVQEFMRTDFDWRVGVLNREPLFVCRYFMSHNHWQIYHHGQNQKTIYGKSETIPVHQAPAKVINVALKAANSIGNGLYGVDLKEVDGKVSLIEINDNPNIDGGTEDAYLGNYLYGRLMEEFRRRIEQR